MSIPTITKSRALYLGFRKYPNFLRKKTTLFGKIKALWKQLWH
jgi:hypothetical protein